MGKFGKGSACVHLMDKLKIETAGSVTSLWLISHYLGTGFRKYAWLKLLLFFRIVEFYGVLKKCKGRIALEVKEMFVRKTQIIGRKFAVGTWAR